MTTDGGIDFAEAERLLLESEFEGLPATVVWHHDFVAALNCAEFEVVVCDGKRAGEANETATVPDEGLSVVGVLGRVLMH